MQVEKLHILILLNLQIIWLKFFSSHSVQTATVIIHVQIIAMEKIVGHSAP